MTEEDEGIQPLFDADTWAFSWDEFAYVGFTLKNSIEDDLWKISLYDRSTVSGIKGTERIYIELWMSPTQLMQGNIIPCRIFISTVPGAYHGMGVDRDSINITVDSEYSDYMEVEDFFSSIPLNSYFKEEYFVVGHIENNLIYLEDNGFRIEFPEDLFDDYIGEPITGETTLNEGKASMTMPMPTALSDGVDQEVHRLTVTYTGDLGETTTTATLTLTGGGGSN